MYQKYREYRPYRKYRSHRCAPLILAFFAALFMTLFKAQGALASGVSLAHWANHAESGVFLLRAAPGQDLQPATLLKTDVDIRVSGPLAQVTVTQHFFNQGEGFGEGIYVFPLPETAAVSGMEMVLGERRIVGEIHERAEAKRIYEQARREGKRAGLVEQQRPNIFTTSVANIGAGEQIAVVITYTEMLTLHDNRFQLRFPMTLTPRYRPLMTAGAVHALDLPPEGGPMPSVHDAIEPTAPLPQRQPDVSGAVIDPAWLPPHANRATVRAHIDIGQPLSMLHSSSHDIRQHYDGRAYSVSLSEPSVAMDRDFLLSWEPRSDYSNAALFTEEVDGGHYALLTLMPPRIQAATRLPREIIFIIDTSGSMGGESIRQAKAGLQHALQRLHPDDRFNIVEFDSSYSTLFPQTVAAAADKLARAQQFVFALSAGGGTEMLPALTAALTMPGAPELLRQVVFITDGAVGNEHAVFGAIHQLLGDARLFTVGIGSAPNSYFMRKAALFGRGSFTYISATDQVTEQMGRLFTTLENPVLRDIQLNLPNDIEAEIWPAKIPDLYAGEALTVAMKLSRLPESITVYGNGDTRWQQSVSLPEGQAHPGIASVWARRKIESLMDRMTRGEPEAELRPAIVAVALEHHLASRYTSFVAVDQTPVRDPLDPLATEQLPNLIPKGFAYPQTALGLAQLWLWGGLLAIISLLFWLRLRMRNAQHAAS